MKTKVADDFIGYESSNHIEWKQSLKDFFHRITIVDHDQEIIESVESISASMEIGFMLRLSADSRRHMSTGEDLLSTTHLLSDVRLKSRQTSGFSVNIQIEESVPDDVPDRSLSVESFDHLGKSDGASVELPKGIRELVLVEDEVVCPRSGIAVFLSTPDLRTLIDPVGELFYRATPFLDIMATHRVRPMPSRVTHRDQEDSGTLLDASRSLESLSV